MQTIRIHDLNGSALAFDVRDVLRVLAPRSLAAIWTISSPSESAFEATGAGGLRLEELADVSARIIGAELLSIADDTVQVVWGDFIGVLPESPDQQWLTVRAVDSSFFEIETSDQIALAAVKASFMDVRIA